MGEIGVWIQGNCERLTSTHEVFGIMPGNQENMRKLQQQCEIKKQSFPLVGIDMGKRRSFGCCSKVELTNFSIFNGVQVVSIDMSPFMQIHDVDITRKTYDSLEKFAAKMFALFPKKINIKLL